MGRIRAKCRGAPCQRNHQGCYQARYSPIDLVGSKLHLRKLHFKPSFPRSEASPIPRIFFDLLFSIPNLFELSLCLPSEHIEQVQKEFNVVGDVLPRLNVKSLPTLESLTVSSSQWIFVVECCPQLKSLQIFSLTYSYQYPKRDVDVVRLGKSHPGLTRLHCQDAAMRSHIHSQSYLLLQICDV